MARWGGLQTAGKVSRIRPENSPDSRNGFLVPNSELSTRPGVAKLNSVAIGDIIRDISCFESDDGVTQRDIAITNDGRAIEDPENYAGEEFDLHSDSGRILSVDDYDYDTARSTSESFSALSIAVGQLTNPYVIHRAFLLFDTSTIPDNATISDVKLKMQVISFIDTDFDVRIHKYNWDNPLSDSNREANYDGALTATLDQIWRNTSGMATDTYYTSPSLDTTWVNTTGYTKYCLVSSADVDGTPDRGRIVPHRLATAGKFPQLIIQYFI